MGNFNPWDEFRADLGQKILELSYDPLAAFSVFSETGELKDEQVRICYTLLMEAARVLRASNKREALSVVEWLAEWLQACISSIKAIPEDIERKAPLEDPREVVDSYIDNNGSGSLVIVNNDGTTTRFMGFENTEEDTQKKEILEDPRD